jgi:pantoate--beta-alanine ligase
LLESEPLIERIDYISVADAGTLEELDLLEGPAMVSVAVKLGYPRLIDNIILE